MSISNGQAANATNFNNSFMSRSSDTSTTGKVDLNNGDSAAITDLQSVVNGALTDISTAQSDITSLDTRVDALEAQESVATHSADTTSVHGIADTSLLVTTTGTQQLTNKDIDGGTASNSNRITLPKATKATLDGLTRKEGTIVYGTDSAKAYVDNGSTLVAIGSGSSFGINYMSSNPDAETDDTGWTDYADGAATPVDLTGGSPSATMSRTTSTPLRGNASFSYSYGALGNGTAYTITPDRADLLKGAVLEISFDYSLDGSISDGDYQIWVYDVFNSTLIQPTPYKIPSGVTGVAYSWKGTFQLPTNGTTFRIGLHQSVSTTTSVKTDNWYCGPQIKSVGAAITDWGTLSGVTLSNAGNATVSAKYRQVGDSYDVWGIISIGSSLPTGSITLNLPFSIDTSKTSDISGVAKVNDGGAVHLGTIEVSSATALLFYGDDASAVWNATTPVTFTNGDSIEFSFTAPVVGKSSNMVLSSDTDGRDLNEIYSGTVAMNNGVGSPVNLSTKVLSTHGAVTTGASWKFTAPFADVYTVNFNGTSDQTTTTGECFAYLYKGGSLECDLAYQHKTSASNFRVRLIGSYDIFLNAGEYIDIRLAATGFSANIAARVAISKTGSHNQMLIASETVAARFTTAAGQSIANGGTPIIDFGTKVFDTHSAVTTGASWKFTAPMAGKYRINANISYAAASFTAGNSVALYLYKNNGGSYTSRKIGRIYATGVGTPVNPPPFVDTIDLLAGDYIDIRTSHDESTARSLSADATQCFITVERVGQ